MRKNEADSRREFPGSRILADLWLTATWVSTSRKVKSWKDLIFNIVDLAKVEDEVISVDFVAIFEVGTADIFVRGVWEEVMWGALWDR